MVPHLQAWDYISLTGSTEGRLVEWVDHLHQHFQEPPRVERARYVIPDTPGYSTKFKVRSALHGWRGERRLEVFTDSFSSN